MQQSAIMIIVNLVFKIICCKLRILVVTRNKGLPELPPKRAENGLFCASKFPLDAKMYHVVLLLQKTHLVVVSIGNLFRENIFC